MAGISRAALAEVTAMDRKRACLARAAACRERAAADAQDYDYWMQQAIRWLDIAQEPSGPVVVTFEAGGSAAGSFEDNLTTEDATPHRSSRRRGRRPVDRALKRAQSSIIQVTDAISPTNPTTAMAMK
jgi:hypothetical protein